VVSCSPISRTPAGRGRPSVAGRDACSPLRRPCTRCRPPSIRRVATFHLRCTRAHPPCHNVALSVHTCASTVSQPHTLGAQMRTHRVTTSHPRYTPAHPPCHSVTPSVHTFAPTASQRCTLGAHMRTGHAASSHARCAGAHASRCSVPLRRFLALPLTTRFHGPISFATESKIVRPPALAAVGGTGVLNKHIRPVPARELS